MNKEESKSTNRLHSGFDDCISIAAIFRGIEFG
jgi:hypothetical protein